MSPKSADERLVRAADTHSAETSLIVWHLEQWLRETINSQTRNPETFLLSGSSKKLLDVVQIATNVKKMYREIYVGHPQSPLRPSEKAGDEQDIQCCLDYMRHFVNRAKHVRYEGFVRTEGFVYATDLSSVFETSALLRSMLFLVHGAEKLLTPDVKNSIPHLAKMERYYVSRLFYAAKNSSTALHDGDVDLAKMRKSMALKYPNMDWKHKVPATALTLELLPKVRWIDCRPFIHDEFDNITKCFRNWIQRNAGEADFRRLVRLEQSSSTTNDELIEETMITIFPSNDHATRMRNSKLMTYESTMDEPNRILDLLWYTRHKAKKAINLTDPFAYASAHELLAISGAAIEIMRALGWKHKRVYRKSLKTFDILVRLFTEHINAIDNPLLGDNEFWEVIRAIEKSRPGLIFFDIDWNQVFVLGLEYSKLSFDQLQTWKAEQDSLIELNATVENIVKEGGGMIAIEIPSTLANGWKTIKIIYRFGLPFFPPSLSPVPRSPDSMSQFTPPRVFIFPIFSKIADCQGAPLD